MNLVTLGLPHGYCLRWDPELLWVTVVAHGVIAVAYYSIPIALIYLARRKADLIWNWLFSSFAIFIFCCGTSHVLNIVVVWQPVYWLLAGVDVATAVSSLFTAMALIAVIPSIEQALQSPVALRALLDRVNTQLESMIEKAHTPTHDA